MNVEGKVTMSHGSGGAAMHRLIEEVFRRKFSSPMLDEMGDSAALAFEPGDCELMFTTDSYVVKPLFFQGGDIGKLAACGTMNDLAVTGARPLFLTAGFIVEEGFEIGLLERIADSMARECREEGASVAAGDFKVVEKGAADGVYINTSGIGLKPRDLRFRAGLAEPGDSVLINGTVGDHETAVLVERGDFSLEGVLQSDCCSLYPLIDNLCGFHAEILRRRGEEAIRFMRDPTRGGVGAVLNEIAGGLEYGIRVFEEELPVLEEVAFACEMLGLNPAYMANEGKVVLVANGKYAGEVLEIMRSHPLGSAAGLIGEVTAGAPAGKVVVRTLTGADRLLPMPEGGQLPRIC